MDVTCDRCSTEYEFEEALVSPRGTTVKCTQCGHLFKVYRPERPLNAQLLAKHWTIRRGDGTTEQLSSLGELTRMIAEGTFARDDEVSRTSKAWRRLGDVEELEAFFAEADRRDPSRARPSGAGPQPAAAKVEAPDRSPQRQSDPAPPAANSGSPAAVGPSQRAPSSRSNPALRVPAPAAPALRTDRVSPQPRQAGEPITDEDEIATEQRSLPGRSAPEAPGAAPAWSEVNRTPPLPPMAAKSDGSASALQFTDLSERGPGFESNPRQALSRWLIAAGLATAAIAGWLFWPARPAGESAPAARPPAEDPSVQFLTRADANVASHRSEHFESAITDYIKALAFHENDPHVLSLLSRVYAIWAQELRFAAQSDRPDADKGKNAPALKDDQFQNHAEKAKYYAETAARRNPGNSEAEVALSDALRLTGNLVAARSELDRALSTEHNPSAEMLRVAALPAIDEASGDARVGLQLASQAAAKEPDLIRTQLLLARCLARDGDIKGARYHLGLVTMRDRDLPAAVAVEQLIARLSVPGSAREDEAAEAPSRALTDAATPQFDNLSHEGYISRGQTLLEAGQVAGAKRLFEQALFIRPNSTQAHAGLGYVALEKGRPQLAVEHFLAATRAGNDEALIGLGDAYRRLQRPRDALRAYQNYLNRNPNGKQVSIARAQVERLGEEVGPGKKAP